MVTKLCPKCTQQVPVACKACPCGHTFFTARRPVSIHKTGENLRDEKGQIINRRRTERVHRERPDYFSSLHVNNQSQQLGSASGGSAAHQGAQGQSHQSHAGGGAGGQGQSSVHSHGTRKSRQQQRGGGSGGTGSGGLITGSGGLGGGNGGLGGGGGSNNSTSSGTNDNEGSNSGNEDQINNNNNGGHYQTRHLNHQHLNRPLPLHHHHHQQHNNLGGGPRKRGRPKGSANKIKKDKPERGACHNANSRITTRPHTNSNTVGGINSGLRNANYNHGGSGGNSYSGAQTSSGGPGAQHHQHQNRHEIELNAAAKQAAAEKEEDLFSNLSAEQSLHYSIILAEINRKLCAQQFKI